MKAMNDRDAIDGVDMDDWLEMVLEEDTEVAGTRPTRSPLYWLDPVCDCGSKATYGDKIPVNAHSQWCSVRER